MEIQVVDNRRAKPDNEIIKGVVMLEVENLRNVKNFRGMSG
jgi:hypothetical protein